jgi:hypothetical protein
MLAMSFVSRQTCQALLLLLLLSHAALTLHVTTHIPVDQTTCEYCAGHANPAHALVAPQIELPRVDAEAADSERGTIVPRVARPVHYRERAPPAVV